MRKIKKQTLDFHFFFNFLFASFFSSNFAHSGIPYEPYIVGFMVSHYMALYPVLPVFAIAPHNALHAFVNNIKNRKLTIFSQNYLKNHWTNPRPACTHLNAFFMMDSIWQMKD